jgi:uncharacterized FAD-dependent dehydrogenase
MDGREVPERILAVLERIAKANEDLIVLATEERDEQDSAPAPPPYCPHCRKPNPVIRNEGGTGDFADFVLVAKCECGEMFYAKPEDWNVYLNKEDAAAALGGGE